MEELMQTLFTVSLIVEIIFAIGFVAIPATLLGSFGVSPDAFGIALSRLFGSALLGFCTLLWYARSSRSADMHKYTIRTMFIYNFGATIFLFLAMMGGIMNSMGWGAMIMHLGFTIWFGVYAFRR
jgi:hypothetical protein